MKKEHIVNYADNISDTLTETIILLGKEVKKQLNEVKKNFKNPRNPTDILVYTDGYSYSAASIFLKYLQYYGGGITAGYFYNPNLKTKNIPFDSSSSPSIIYDYFRLYMLSPEGYKPFYDYFNFQMKLPGIQTFYSPNNLSIPLEYQITPVDEITNIFEMFTDENYDLFVNESLEVFKKYKTRCNPKNKKLVFYTSKCDGSFKNKYTHGGYECGDDGLWTTKCVPSYCDIGYIFDYTKNKCIYDICSGFERKEEEEEEEKEKKEEKGNIVSLIIVFYIYEYL
jgi:hypothetical protein